MEPNLHSSFPEPRRIPTAEDLAQEKLEQDLKVLADAYGMNLVEQITALLEKTPVPAQDFLKAYENDGRTAMIQTVTKYLRNPSDDALLQKIFEKIEKETGYVSTQPQSGKDLASRNYQ